MIIRNDIENEIKVVKIGEFVDKFIPHNPKETEVMKIGNYSALSFDGKKTCFLPLTHVHKHKRQSEVVEAIFSSGFRTMVTRDHSFFTFNSNGKLTPSAPKKNMFAKICLTAPSIQEEKMVDLAKDLFKKLPSKHRNRVYCSVGGLSQSKMRILSSNKKFLSTLSNPKDMESLARESTLDKSAVTDVSQRLIAENFITISPKARKKIITITKKGEEYLDYLKWLFNNCHYYKKKYRVHIEKVACSKIKLEKFCEIFIHVYYGKIKLPRFLQANPSLAELLGLYVAEGDTRNTTQTSDIHLAAQKKGMQERMARCVREGLKLEPYVNWRGIDIHSKLAHFLIKYVFGAGVGAYNKEVPSIIFTLPNEHKWRFLEGYARGDGHITDKRIVLTTASKKLVTGLIFLLRQLGIKKITLQKSSKRNTYEVCIMESVPFNEINVDGNKCYYDVYPVAQSNEKTFSLMKNEYVSQNSNAKTRQKGSVNEQNCFDYIKKIIPLKEQPEYVYDISVKKTELFIGGQGLVCLHNSVAEEGLDIPSVDLVVFYEPVPSEIRLIQRRGRTGRKNAGKVIILMAEKTMDEAMYWASKRKEKNMHETLRRLSAIPTTHPIPTMHPPSSGETNPTQSTLGVFGAPTEKIYVFADTREQASAVMRELSFYPDVNVQAKVLEVGDFVVGPDVVIERKTIEDFLQSLIDGRLMGQLLNMSQAYARPLMLLEGNPADLFTLRNVHENAIIGMMSTIAVTYRIPILFTKDAKESAKYVYAIAKKEQSGKTSEIRLRMGRKGLALHEQQRFLIEGLPNIGPGAAIELLRHFGSVQRIMNAEGKELQTVANIGPKKIEALHRVIRSPYDPQTKHAKSDPHMLAEKEMETIGKEDEEPTPEKKTQLEEKEIETEDIAFD
ncbi:MAG: ERCC4 domain-containing protein [archaeon]